MEQAIKVEMKNIVKSFGGVQALKNGNISVRPGEIHALIGENGAGKSTLIKVLAGAIKRDEGSIRIDGKDAAIETPLDSIKKRIAVIYQEFMLAPDLSVAENIFIDRLSAGKFVINWKQLKNEANKILSTIGFENIDPNARVGDLSVAYQQVVEICKSVSRDAHIFVFDEPTAVLTTSEIHQLFKLMRYLREKGASIIYISHRLDEIFEVCDRVTVMKDGEYIDTVETASITKQELVSKMIGRDLKDLYPSRSVEIGREVMKIEHVRSGNAVQDVSLSVCAGEVVGLAGLVGAGRTEAMQAVFGARKLDGGSVWYNGHKIRFGSPKESVKHKLGYLPEDRKVKGLVLDQSIRVNVTLAALHLGQNKLHLIEKKRETKCVEQILARLETKFHSAEDPASSLSGGNQQKVAIAKWLAADCQVIVLDEPTRGVDVGAKTEIYKIINQMVSEGKAVIMISSEMPEIIQLCDRVFVVRQGRTVAELPKQELSENALISLMVGEK